MPTLTYSKMTTLTYSKMTTLTYSRSQRTRNVDLKGKGTSILKEKERFHNKSTIQYNKNGRSDKKDFKAKEMMILMKLKKQIYCIL